MGSAQYFSAGFSITVPKQEDACVWALSDFKILCSERFEIVIIMCDAHFSFILLQIFILMVHRNVISIVQIFWLGLKAASNI